MMSLTENRFRSLVTVGEIFLEKNEDTQTL